MNEGNVGIKRERPDFILFMVDQLSAKWLEVPSRYVCPTPNIDRLRRRAGLIVFSCIYEQSPVPPVSYDAFYNMTSRCHGLLQKGNQLDPSHRSPLP